MWSRGRGFRFPRLYGGCCFTRCFLPHHSFQFQAPLAANARGIRRCTSTAIETTYSPESLAAWGRSDRQTRMAASRLLLAAILASALRRRAYGRSRPCRRLRVAVCQSDLGGCLRDGVETLPGGV